MTLNFVFMKIDDLIFCDIDDNLKSFVKQVVVAILIILVLSFVA